MDRDHELSAVLADDTRYRIYRAIAERPGEDVTVADIAERFDLHPNVARMHLSKLEQAGFLATDLRRTSGGGRPAKLYRLSDLVVTFGFPPRRYELLSRLALSALSAGGSRDDALRVCREAGAAEGRRALAGEAAAPRDRAAAAELVRRIADEQGLLPEVALAGPGARGRRPQLHLPRALRRRPGPRLRHASRLPRGRARSGDRRPRATAHQPRRLPHQLWRRALRDALHLRPRRRRTGGRRRVIE